MTDENKTPESNANDDLKKKRDAELFGDINSDDETLEEVKADRDALLQSLATMTGSLTSLQNENTALVTQLGDQKKEATLSLNRVKAQFEEQKVFALEKFVKEILPVIDNLELGLANIPADQRVADPKFGKLAQGVEKTLGQLTAVFNKFGIKEINPVGQTFDPAKHDAISVDDSADVESETVVKVMQKGYELNERVIRNAKVVVKP